MDLPADVQDRIDRFHAAYEAAHNRQGCYRVSVINGTYVVQSDADRDGVEYNAAEFEEHIDFLRYGYRAFSDVHGRRVKVDETLSLRDALAILVEADRNLTKARNYEATVSGRDAYAAAQAVSLAARQAKKLAQNNVAAAFIRETGQSPSILRDLGVN